MCAEGCERGGPSATGSRRRRLWELDPKCLCPIVGTCFSLAELRAWVEADLGLGAATDFEVHVVAVRACERRSALSERLQRVLERRAALAIARLRAARSPEAVLAAWREAVERADVAATLWAVLTHPRADEATVHAVYGEIHMLQHQCAGGERAVHRQVAWLAAERDALAGAREAEQGRAVAERARLEARLRAVEAERDAARAERVALQARCEQLQARCERLRAERDAREPAQAPDPGPGPNAGAGAAPGLGTGAAPGPGEAAWLRAALVQAHAEREALAAERDAAHEALAAAREAAVQACAALEAAGAASACAAADEAAHACAPAGAIAGRAVACIGGRPGALDAYRRVAARCGARLLHHDGGLEESAARVEAVVAAADAVICQAGCVSHGAYWRVKDLCRRSGKPCVFVATPSVTGFARGLEALARAAVAPG